MDGDGARSRGDVVAAQPLAGEEARAERGRNADCDGGGEDPRGGSAPGEGRPHFPPPRAPSSAARALRGRAAGSSASRRPRPPGARRTRDPLARARRATPREHLAGETRPSAKRSVRGPPARRGAARAPCTPASRPWGQRAEEQGDPEIEHLHVAFRGEEDVRGLQVAMHDPVKRARGRGRVRPVTRSRSHRSAGSGPRASRLSSVSPWRISCTRYPEPLRRGRRRRTSAAMLGWARRAAISASPRGGGVGRLRSVQDLQRYEPVERRVVRLVDRAEAAMADRADDLVTADASARREQRRRVSGRLVREARDERCYGSRRDDRTGRGPGCGSLSSRRPKRASFSARGGGRRLNGAAPGVQRGVSSAFRDASGPLGAPIPQLLLLLRHPAAEEVPDERGPQMTKRNVEALAAGAGPLARQSATREGTSTRPACA